MTDPRGATEAQRPKVIYVMGAGRSGSTILGVALGNCENVFFAGELNQWLTRFGRPSLGDAARAGFWDAVRQDMSVAPELLGGAASCLERSSALLNLRKWPVRRRLRPPYRIASEELYCAIGRAAGAAYVVDTSHYPLRAREVQALRGVDLYLLFLARDPQGVVASLDRDDVPERRFGAYAANAYLWLTNTLALLVFLRHPRARRLFVRHEDFAADPYQVLRRILQQAGSDASPSATGSLRTGVPFHGNRLIGLEEIAVEQQAAARNERSLLTAMLQLPWTAIFSRLRPSTSVPASHDEPSFEPHNADSR
jgi:Sulfotransferase family